MRRFVSRILLPLPIVFALSLWARNTPSPACSITPITNDKNLANMFSPSQEVELGEVLTQVVRDSEYELDEPDLDSYLQSLGDRLAANLPALGLKFRFYLSNEPVANAYSIAGGRVYVTRKLVGFVRSEDELAGVLTHELGHIVTHQTAIDYTRFFKAIGINEVSDRADIEAKLHRFLESGKKFYVSEEDRQLQADRVGLELLALSGYRTDAPAEFFDRLTNNRGRTGSWISNLFGTTIESSKRFREMQKSIRNFPTECVHRDSAGAAGFHDWQAKVVAYSGTGRTENIPGLISKKALEPPLQDEVHTLRFSYDGKYLLAQDDGSIYVLTREPLAFKFRIDAPEAYPARFTWDSKQITFYNPDLHVEVWNADTGVRDKTFELVSSHGCLQTALSPDAKTLACIDGEETLVLLDTETEVRAFERKNIRHGDSGFKLGIGGYQYKYELRFLNIGFSLDGRYFVVAGENVVLAVDVPARHEIPIPGSLKGYLQGAFAFVSDKTLVGNQKNGAKAGVFTFPEGQILNSIELAASAPFPVAKGEYVLMRPIHDYEVGVLDLKSNQIVRASKTPAIDVYEDTAASMLGSGEVGLFGKSATPLAKLSLPRGHFGGLRAVAFSEDSSWLAISTRSRGSVWDLANSNRPYNLKGFRDACFAKDGNLYLDFPKREKVDRSIVRADLHQAAMSIVQKVDPGRVWEDCTYTVRLRRNEEEGAPKDKDTKDTDEDDDKRDFRFEGRRVNWRESYNAPETNRILEVSDALTGKLLWSKPFPKAIPWIYTDSQANVAVFRWHLGSEGAKTELKTIPRSVANPGKGHEDDYLIEIVELGTGKFVNALILDSANGAIVVHRNIVFGDWLVAQDSVGRTLVYSLKTGKNTAKFFGTPRQISSSGLLVVQHNPGRIGVYDLATGQKTDVTMTSPISNGAFTPDGKKLLLVTNDQMVYTVAASPSK